MKARKEGQSGNGDQVQAELAASTEVHYEDQEAFEHHGLFEAGMGEFEGL